MSGHSENDLYVETDLLIALSLACDRHIVAGERNDLHPIFLKYAF